MLGTSDTEKGDAARQSPALESQREQHSDKTAINAAGEHKVTGIRWFIVNVSLLSATFLICPRQYRHGNCAPGNC